MKTKRINDQEASTLANICRVAAERFDEHAREFHKAEGITAGPKGALFPTGETAKLLALQFERQAAEARAFAGLFESCEPFVVTFEEDDAEAA